MLSELFASVSAKVAAASFAAVTTAGTGAAAATGNLPDDLQDRVSQAASSVGIELPDSSQDISAEDVRQDTDVRQDDGNRPEAERDETGDEVLDTLRDVDPTEDGQGFGEDVSDKATTDGEGLGENVSGSASDGASDQGGTSSTAERVPTPGDNAADESDATDDHRKDAPSGSGDEYRDSGSSNAESGSDNPGSDSRRD